MTDEAQLGIFIRDVDASLTVTEEFVLLVPMTDTSTGNDVFASLVGVGKKKGVVVKLREKVRAVNPEC